MLESKREKFPMQVHQKLPETVTAKANPSQADGVGIESAKQEANLYCYQNEPCT